MRTFYSLQDIEDFISQGITRLIIDDNTTITGPARDLLRQHNIPVINEQERGGPNSSQVSAPVRQAPAPDTPVSRSGRVPMLQLALDYISVPSAVAMAVQVQEFVDIIEIGTPLIKVAGVEGVKAMREVCPEKYILADFKTPDVGGLEAQLAFDAGADFVSIIGGATIATVKEALKVANGRPGKEIVMECTGVRDILGMAREWKEIGVTRLVYHREWDAQAAGREWEEEDRRQIQEIINMGYNVTVTGGLTPELLPFFAGLDVSVFICGRGIHQAKDPREAAKKMRDTIWSIWGRPGAGRSTAGPGGQTEGPAGTSSAADSFVDRAVDALKKRK
jgi:3-dehydro-L-gulonate-6-phosphate decarboxylase